MPERALVAKELGHMLGVLSHPQRIRIVEELRGEERDVTSLQGILGISHAGVSQHLSLLRAHRLVDERREGRHVYYRLRQPELAAWLAMGIRFLGADLESHAQFQSALERVRVLWPETSPKP